MPLDPWIIEEIKKREEAERREREGNQPRIEAPPPSRPDDVPAPKPDEEKDRGVTIIDISGDNDDEKKKDDSI